MQQNYRWVRPSTGSNIDECIEQRSVALDLKGLHGGRIRPVCARRLMRVNRSGKAYSEKNGASNGKVVRGHHVD